MQTKVQNQKLPLLIALCTCAFVVGAIALWRTHFVERLLPRTPEVSHAPLEKERDITPDWRRIEIQGDVVLYLPPDLRSEAYDQGSGYRAFRNSNTELVIAYDLINHVATCACLSDERITPRTRLGDAQLAGRQAKIERIDKIPFNLEDDVKLAVRGFAICVPDVGDGAHEFAVVGKYKSEQDYQTLARILDSIKFRNG